jgi:hypothetical protein
MRHSFRPKIKLYLHFICIVDLVSRLEMYVDCIKSTTFFSLAQRNTIQYLVHLNRLTYFPTYIHTKIYAIF